MHYLDAILRFCSGFWCCLILKFKWYLESHKTFIKHWKTLIVSWCFGGLFTVWFASEMWGKTDTVNNFSVGSKLTLPAQCRVKTQMEQPERTCRMLHVHLLGVSEIYKYSWLNLEEMQIAMVLGTLFCMHSGGIKTIWSGSSISRVN